MKIQHISDSHCKHSQINISTDVDLIIHSGDASNSRNVYENEKEIRDFITWYSSLNIPYKIYIAGNHCTSIANSNITKDNFEQAGIIYLEHESTEVLGLKIFGSPYTPNFGNGWAYNVRRDRLHEYWKVIPYDVDIIVTHGPPKGILDLVYHTVNEKEQLEYCGDLALLKRIKDIKC